MPTPSIQSATSSMTARVLSNSLTAPCWSTTTVSFSRSKTFRLNYTARSADAHKFLVVVEDNFGSTPWEHTFEFNGKDSGDDGGKTPGIVNPVNPGTITPIVR